ncbi:circadian-associated transcriptional repressor-like [Megalops cyprinoides]|uniref:circadian-associated transcriptional repressor-like n=1 Tax=Megalops cyprinoides TaxID=118141 RepID=UPI0018644148|nr:circadian-associated transcriptional repressor-like [Megalops cyprinoides]
MTASDSDCSVDWLASEDDDSNGAFEPDCGQRAGAGRTLPLPAPSGDSRAAHPQRWSPATPRGGDAKEDESRLSRDSDDSSCAESWDSEGQGEQSSPCTPAQRPRQAQKRPYSQGAPEPQEVEDKLFARKCKQLQCYVHPLSSILIGLQSGRYRQRLSSFQESVAMDRIRRILGVLQNPCVGERYINIILKVEVMLKTWFPNVRPTDQQVEGHSQEATPSKRQKICPLTTPLPGPVSIPASFGGLPGNQKAQRACDYPPPGTYSATNLKWLHTSPICSPVVETAVGGPRGKRDVTQDNAVSSSTDPDSEPSTDLKAGPPPHSRPPMGKISAPCLERLLKSSESIITRRGANESGWS